MDEQRRKYLLGGLAALGVAALPASALADYVDPDDPYPLPPADLSRLAPEFRRQPVNYTGSQRPGTVIVDTDARQLYHIMEGGWAMRYGVGVGREGFRWAGIADVGRKIMWPKWTPPAEMVARDKNAAKWANGMPGGPNNPLGARALYLYKDGRDTLYRIHGTNAPDSIGKFMSSGCIRMLNQDVIELYRRTPTMTRVVVIYQGQD